MEHRVYPFEFSVIMAVYNVEPWLREAVDSLIAQDFGFENIQLIFVDDGSTDGSGMICDEYAARYPDNVLVIHKENGGVASARNEGLKYATGRFLNFMDSDDKFTKDAFRKVYHFFAKHDSEIDIATIPLEFFDAQKGAHWQNGKFDKGTRVLDLYRDYQATIMFVNASFFANRVKKDIVFDSHLVCGEDMKVLLTVAADKMKLGVVADCKYLYRCRSAGEASLIQSAKLKYGWYFDYFTYLIDWAAAYYSEKLGYIPAFVQYELLSDLQWRFRQVYDMSSVLTDQEIEKYKERLFSSLRYFDDKYFLEQKMIWGEHKCYMLSKKYDCAPTLTPRNSNVLVHFGNTNLPSVADHYSMIEFLTIKNEELIVEGYTKVFGVNEEEPLSVYLRCNGKLLPCEVIQRDNINEYRFDELIFRGIEFCCSIPLAQECEEYKIQLVLEIRGIQVTKRNIRFGKFAPIGKQYRGSYYYQDGWMLTAKENSLFIQNCGRKEHLTKEWMLLRELWNSNKTGERKAVLGRIAYYIFKKLKRKSIWLVSDKANRADDNGEAFFIYLRKLRPKGIKPYFLVGKDSPDYKKLRNYGKVLPYMSRRHKIWYFLADYTISAYSHDEINNPFYGYSEPYRDLLQHCKYIFLQHGIIKDDLSIGLNRYHKNIKRFVCSTVPERNSILETPAYGYSSEEIILTGLPRYDRLYHAEKNEIVIMPTWRRDLFGGYHSQNSQWDLKPGFPESDYYKFYNDLVNNERLLNAATAMGYTINFVPHPIFFPYIDMFSVPPEVKLWGGEVIYRQMFAENKLLITDFSSVAFDFAYLRKPVVYAHFDTNHYQEGYFDYERDGFGEVEYDLESTVNRIIEYMENGCQLKEKYRARIDGFFAFNDQNNCQRVYEKIMELDKGK